MSEIEKSCLKYTNFTKIALGTYGNIYKAQNKETKYDVAIKEIDKQKYKYLTNIELKETEINKIKTQNSLLVKEFIDSKDYFFIVMYLCYCNLEEYIIKRENNLSINEIKEVLIQLNNSLKIIEKEKLIYKDLKPSNILISINKLDKCLIKLSKFANKLVNVQLTSMSIKGAPLTTSPEILNGENNNNKCDIWSLGIIIYFMLFKEYPYTGKNEILLIKDIMSNKNL